MRRNSAHIIGVVVSEITSEIMTAKDSVTVNSRNNRPRMPPISRIGRNTAISDRLIDTTVKPTSRAPRSAACKRGMPGLEVTRNIFKDDNCVVDHEARSDRKRHQ